MNKNNIILILKVIFTLILVFGGIALFLLGLILPLKGIIKNPILSIFLIVFGFGLSFGTVLYLDIQEKKSKKLAKQSVWESLSDKEFSKTVFKQRNDPVVNAILENAEVYIKKDNENEKSVVVKIKFLTDEVVTEVPLEWLGE